MNLVAGEGNPAAVMDTSFAVQALALAWLAGCEPGEGKDASMRGQVLEVSPSIDAQVASLTLASLGTKIDTLTDAQRIYLESWRRGS